MLVGIDRPLSLSVTVSLNVVLNARLDGSMNVAFAVLAPCSVIEAKKLRGLSFEGYWNVIGAQYITNNPSRFSRVKPLQN
jgi:hypothetical protein